jgi:protein-tyrosine phosphatase
MPYVDLHCHILPGLDDGSRSLADAVRYARLLDAEDVLDVACTSHIKRGHFPHVDLWELAGRRAELQDAIDAENLKVTLHPGGELAHEDALALPDRELELIAQGPAHARWLLLECPFRGLDDDFDAAVERLTDLGYGLLLAHPERIVDGDLSRLAPHTEAGALLQVNVSSLLGAHGPNAQGIAARLVHTGRAYCLASDTHPGSREEILPFGYDAVRRLGVSDVQAFRLTQSNPRFLLREGNPRLALPETEDRANSTR